MRLGDGRLSRRAVCGALAAATLLASLPSRAQDVAGAVRELAESSDFRVRMNAALFLGRSKAPEARPALERALADPHGAVRVAVAAALGALGDAAAIVALSRRLSSEPSASVRAEIHTSIDRLRQGVAAEQAGSDASRGRLRRDVRYVVKLGTMRNPTGVRGDELRRFLRDVARSRARSLRGAAVADAPRDGVLLAAAAARHLPVITLDGSLMQLTESHVGGSVQVQARVEFALRREQTLKGTLSGAATTFGSTPTLDEQGRRQLQDDAVDGAVQSALRGAEQQLATL